MIAATSSLSSGDRLALRAHTGDAQAVEQLLAAYQPLFRSESRKVKIPNTDLEDLEQVARLAALKALAHYDPARGPWGALLQTCVRRALSTEYQRHDRDCRRPKEPCRSLQSLREEEPDGDDLEQTTVARLYAGQVAAFARERVHDPIDQVILAGIREGASLAELAPRVGLTPQALGRRRERLLERLRACLTARGYA